MSSTSSEKAPSGSQGPTRRGQGPPKAAKEHPKAAKKAPSDSQGPTRGGQGPPKAAKELPKSPPRAAEGVPEAPKVNRMDLEIAFWLQFCSVFRKGLDIAS